MDVSGFEGHRPTAHRAGRRGQHAVILAVNAVAQAVSLLAQTAPRLRQGYGIPAHRAKNFATCIHLSMTASRLSSTAAWFQRAAEHSVPRHPLSSAQTRKHLPCQTCNGTISNTFCKIQPRRRSPHSANIAHAGQQGRKERSRKPKRDDGIAHRSPAIWLQVAMSPPPVAFSLSSR